ncbi:hypothetical protein ASPZODRAFT_132606 [Penicilliopsis zonata CBS 506.65]|uniref:Uncharacterized protein n=1 Tax=Penicilliopsis zonata CBS 506.65 TaxID=1073090 RepID=A0A1L9SH63_9EURO|nr:hypothetical protein ASPZODRAFT_132606 [Penicilliopsis zonata CBS 506.65]OJJ46542.1 hypothetical protein ASPZODRAFT_132606 [Penicilliopsis zonata CBS 506.65]
MPLPCPRELWEPVSNTEWEKRYHEHIEQRKGKQGLTLRILVLLQQSPIHDDITALDAELSRWCKGVDDLSMLLWMGLGIKCEGI